MPLTEAASSPVRSSPHGPVSDAAVGALLLLASGGAIGLALATLLWGDRADFLLHNRIPDALRDRILALGGAGALALAGAPIARWLTGRIPALRLREIGQRLTPLLPLAIASLLFDAQLWSETRLTHLVLCALLVWLTQRSVRARALAPPLGAERGFAEWIDSAGPLASARALAGQRTLPLLVVLAAAAGYAGWFAWVTLQAHWNGHTRAYDLAIFDNLFWNVVNGGEFLRSTPAGGGVTSHFARHATLLAYVLAPVYALHPSASTLLVVQAALLGFAALPLYSFARVHLGRWTACGIALAFLLYPPLHGSNLYDFHFLSISPLFVFCVAHALETRSRLWLVLAVVLTLTVREDVAVAVAVLGAYHVLANRRVHAGVSLFLAGSAWFLLMKFVLMPMAAPGASYASIYQGLLPEGETGFGGVLRTLLSNPGFVLASLLTLAKLEYALLILVPLAFVPLRRPLGALFLVPGVVFTLLSTDYGPTISITFQYTAFWSPYLFVAAVLLLRTDSFDPPGTPEARAARVGWLSAFALMTLLCSYQYGAIFQQSTAGGGFHEPFPFATTRLDLLQRQLRDEIMEALPPDAKVVASETVAPHVSNRANAYTLREGIRDAEYVVFALVSDTPGELEVLRPLLRSSRYGVVAANRSYALLRRGAPPTDNARVLQSLR